ncbi:MAG TPA: MFS transporter [Bryobacteraceae bacterium]|nr:MFS transporter [Bryobacteraceae bacterium]
METRTTRAWWGTVILFLVHGLVVGTWVSRIPAIKAALHLSNAVLGVTLLSSAVGAMCTIPVTGTLISRFGTKRVSSLSSIAFCLVVNLIALAWNAVSLAVALYIFGGMAAAMDVAMNAQAVEVEKAMAKPTMSRFHAMFSLGAMAGAAAGGWVAAREIAPGEHFAVAGLINLAAVLLAIPLLLETHAHLEQREHRLPLRNLPAVLVALSAIGFCILLSEGAMADWTAVYYRQILHTGPGIAAEGYAVFSAAMAIFRFIGDWITARLGPFRTVRTACIVAACGLLWTLGVHSPVWGLPGLAITGAGLSVIIPLVFGGGGRVPGVNPGPGIATVTGIGYVGFIIGPPTIGFVSQIVTLRYALGIVVGCCLIAGWLSRFMARLTVESRTTPPTGCALPARIGPA